MLSLWMLVLPVVAADPWGRPEELRAVAEAPASLEARGHESRVRLWWEAEAGQDWEIAVLRGGRWRTAARGVQPGWISEAVPLGTRFRVRRSPADRWSPVVGAPALRDPEALARAAATPEALLARTVGQVVRDGDRVAASTLGGGVALLEGGRLVANLGPWDGLPSATAVAVDARDGALLVGTDAGVWWLDPDGLVSVRTGALPSAHVQAVRLDGGRRWVGTDAGLLRWEGEALEVLLRPQAVFSLGWDPHRDELLVGYEGWLRLSPEAPALAPPPVAARPGVDPVPPDPAAEVRGDLPEADFYELLVGPGGELYGASPQLGLWRLEPGEAGPVEGSPAQALGLDLDADGLPWIAGGADGLVAGGHEGEAWPWVGRAGVTWDLVFDGDQRAWVATDRGLGLLGAARGEGRVATLMPVSLWPADLPVSHLAAWRGHLLPGGPEGLRVAGDASPQLIGLVEATEGAVLGLVSGRRGLWVVDEGGVSHLDRRGRLRRHASSLAAREVTPDGDGILVATDGGLQRWSLGPEGLETELLTTGVTRAGLRAGEDLWTTDGSVVSVTGPGGSLQRLGARGPQVLAPGEGGVWVGAWDGLWWADREGMVQVLEGSQVTAVRALADGSCAYGTATGQVGRVGAPGGSLRHLAALDHPVLGLEPDGDQGLWVLSAGGSWWLPLDGGAP